MLRGLGHDLRYALRMLAKAPGTSLAVVASVALGIGANAAIFSLVNALLLRPLPVRAPAEMAAVFTSDYSGPAYGSSSYPDYVDFRDGAPAFAGLAAHTLEAVGLTAGAQSARLWAEVVSGNYFETIGVGALHGRRRAPSDAAPAAAAVAVLSHGVWQARFGGDPGVIGRPVTLSGVSFTIVGIAPASFPGLVRGLDADLWLPLAQSDALGLSRLDNRGSRGLNLLGRLAPGRSAGEAEAQLAVVAKRLHAEFADNWTDRAGAARRVSVLPESAARVPPEFRAPLSGFMGLLMAVVGLVLLIACANVASLLLAKAVARRREIAIRLSLGAGRARVVRQFLVETLLVALAGGGCGVVLAYWATGLAASLQPPVPLPVRLDLTPDARVLLFAFVLTLATGLLLGLAPARAAATQDPAPALKDEARAGAFQRRSRLRGALVLGQVALSLVLLAGATLFVRSLRNATAIDTGFEPHGLGLLSVDAALAGYDEARLAALLSTLEERARGQAGVESVALTVTLPLDPHAAGRRGFDAEGYAPSEGEDMEAPFGVVGAGYFETMRIPLLRGRGFTLQDRSGAPEVAVVNETFARRYFGGGDPIGRRISFEGASGPWIEVVGLARDGKYVSLGEDAKPFVYRPALQEWRYARRMGAFMPASLLVRGRGDTAAALAAVRGVLLEQAPALPVYGARTMQAHLGIALLPARLGGWVLGLFGVVGVALASVGVWGSVAYAVRQREHEIGVRMALGAAGRDVLRLVVGEALRPVALGLALGLPLALGAARLAQGFLYGLSPFDPMTFLGVPALLAAVASLASGLPARRATRIDPMLTLRSE